MPTEISYQNDRLALLNNGTCTIKTKGKYLEDDIIVMARGIGSLQEKTNINPTTSSQTITADNGYDGLLSVQINAMPNGTAGTPIATKGTVSNHSISITPSVVNLTGYITGGEKSGTAVTVSASELVSGTKSISTNGTGIDVTNYAEVDVAVSSTPLQTKSVVPTESAQTVTPDVGYALSEVDIDAIPSDYVGSGITRRTASDLIKSGAIITAPAGYYTESAGRSVDYGQQGTPTISVGSDGLITASCTDISGYITGTTKTATQQMTARTSSDLTVSGATVTAPAGYYNAAASKSVANGFAGTPMAVKSPVSNHTITVTPTATSTAGYISGGSVNGPTVTVSASELVSGSETKTANGTYDVTNLAELVVNVSGGGGSTKNIQVETGYHSRKGTSYAATGLELEVAKSGTYTITWTGWRASSSGTSGSQLYKNGTAVGSAVTTFTGTYGQVVTLTNQSLSAGDVLEVYARSRNTSYAMYVANLIIVEN